MALVTKRGIATVLGCCGLVGVLGTAIQAQPAAQPFHVMLVGKPKVVVLNILAGSARRLGRPSCQALFTDFADAAGRPLAAVLAARNQTPTDFLSQLYFVRGDDSQGCHVGFVNAFTVPGSRVIYVCAERVAQQFDEKTKDGEILIIHELLHALGLGENPPSSLDITAAVMRRCGQN